MSLVGVLGVCGGIVAMLILLILVVHRWRRRRSTKWLTVEQATSEWQRRFHMAAEPVTLGMVERQSTDSNRRRVGHEPAGAYDSEDTAVLPPLPRYDTLFNPLASAPRPETVVVNYIGDPSSAPQPGDVLHLDEPAIVLEHDHRVTASSRL